MELDGIHKLIADGPVSVKMIERPKATPLVNRTASRVGTSHSGGVYRIKQESPRQRLVVELAASGKTNLQIAEITGYNPLTISALLRQPLTQQVLVDTIRAKADRIDEEVLEIVKEGCLESAKRLLKIVKSDSSKGSDHIAAANTFLERRYGKANQPINSQNSVDLNNLSDEELAKQIVTTSTGGCDAASAELANQENKPQVQENGTGTANAEH